ncbi:MAG: TauD/TfdA family dioxygenase, partial [Alphaproteobacteria bacterium]|nr:TauD/TfdA family dioxygenase [Alphaproteobacteria bacterium]
MGVQEILGPLLGDTLGREIVDVDLSKPLSQDILGAIQAVFCDNPVLVFRGQSLGARQTSEFAKRLGPIHPGVIARYQHPEATEIPTSPMSRK